jgi:DNA polymerase-1
VNHYCVLTEQQLDEVVSHIKDNEVFAFDVETRGNIHRHGEVMDLINDEWKEKEANLKATNPLVRQRSRKAIEDRWTGKLALDPLRNEVFWIGIAVRGVSWAIPMGHPHGEVVVPPVVGDGSTVPPPAYRAILSSGKESMAKAKYVIPAQYAEPPAQLTQDVVFGRLEEVFQSDKIAKVGHNIKFDARSVAKYLGGLPQGRYIDTMVLQHFMDENISSFSLQSLISNNFGGIDPYAREGKVGKIINDVAFSVALRYVHLDVRWTWMLYQRMWRRVRRNSDWMQALFTDLDLLHVISDMEQTGIMVDTDAMRVTGVELDQHLHYLKRDMANYAPPGFNPDSLEHKRQLLFSPKDKGGLGLSVNKETPAGKASVDESVLRSISSKHPVVPMLLEWAETKKLKSTYVEGMVPLLHSGRLHPSFHLHRTVTSRVSSSGPNLQNIPRDGRMRSMFVAGEGLQLVVADYDQIELRVMAMFSQDKELLRIFNTGVDIHRGTAALILSKDLDDIDDEERTVYGKVPNFLMGYGGGPKRLVESTNGAVTVKEARRIIDAYHESYSGLTAWKNKEIVRGAHRGFVETLGKRRRRLHDLTSSDFVVRGRAERQAINFIVQGTAAEICKQAMVRVHERLPEGCKLLVQVHDELMIVSPEDDADNNASFLEREMGHGTVINGVPLSVSAHTGYSWYEAKG